MQDRAIRRLFFDAPEAGCPLAELSRDIEAVAGASGRVAGLDEAGRGPWAGPVVAACVVLKDGPWPDGVADSKALNAARREAVLERIMAQAEVGIAVADEAEIEARNILHASLQAMARALGALTAPPAIALVDGNKLPQDLPCPARAVVKGDARIAAIAAASIVAKVTRDRIMADLAVRFPGYGWERNMGYGTPEHARALQALGPTPHHRRGFRPVQAVIAARAAATSNG